MTSRPRHLSYISYTRLVLLAAALLAGGSGGCASKQVVEDRPAAFWPQFPDEPRIQFLTSYETSTDVEPAKSGLDKLIYGKEQEDNLPLNKPYGVEMHDGKIYICDIRSASVTALDLRHHRVLVLGKTQTDTLQTPVDIAIAPDGTKYVADMAGKVVAVYDAADRRIATFGKKDMKPVGLAVWKDELYVADFDAREVAVLDRRSGRQLRTVGEPGGGDGQFVRPLGVTVDAQGNLYVMDVMKCQLQKFDHEGRVLTSFGTITAKAGGLVRPKHIDMDKDGNLFVVDAAFQNVQVFDQTGQVLTFFGAAGSHPGAMYLPAGICIHEGDLDLFADKVHPAFQAERLVLVTNQFGPNKVSVYAMGHLKPGMTVQNITASKGLVPTGAVDTTGAAKTDSALPALPDTESPTALPAAPATPAAPAAPAGPAAPAPAAPAPAAPAPAAPAPAAPAPTVVPGATPAAKAAPAAAAQATNAPRAATPAPAAPATPAAQVPLPPVPSPRPAATAAPAAVPGPTTRSTLTTPATPPRTTN